VSFPYLLTIFFSTQVDTREEIEEAVVADGRDKLSKNKMEEEKNQHHDDQHHHCDAYCFRTPPRRTSSGTYNTVDAGRHLTQSPLLCCGEVECSFSSPNQPPLIHRWDRSHHADGPSVIRRSAEDLEEQEEEKLDNYHHRQEDDKTRHVILPSSSSLLLVTSSGEDSGANALAQEELAFRKLTRDLDARFLARRRSAFEEVGRQQQGQGHGQDLKRDSRTIAGYEDSSDILLDYNSNDQQHLTFSDEDEFFLCLPSDIDEYHRGDRQILSPLSKKNKNKQDGVFTASPLSSLGGTSPPRSEIDASCFSSQINNSNKNHFILSSLLEKERFQDDDDVIDADDMLYRSHDSYRQFASTTSSTSADAAPVEKHFLPETTMDRYFIPIRPRIRDMDDSSVDFLDISKLNKDFPGAADEETTAWLERVKQVAHDCENIMMRDGYHAEEENEMQYHPAFFHDYHPKQQEHPTSLWSLDDNAQDRNKGDPALPLAIRQEQSGESFHKGCCFNQQRKKARTVSIGYDFSVGTTTALAERHHNDELSHHNISSPPRKISYAKKSLKCFGSTSILAPTPIRMKGYYHAKYNDMVITDHHHHDTAKEKTSNTTTTVNGHSSFPQASSLTPMPLHYDCDHRKIGFSEYHRMVHSIHRESPFYKM